jgi:hypothetical protein
MSLIEDLKALTPSRGDAVTRLALTREERGLLDETLLSGLMKDVEVAELLKSHGHDVTAYAVTYYRRSKLGKRVASEHTAG